MALPSFLFSKIKPKCALLKKVGKEKHFIKGRKKLRENNSLALATIKTMRESPAVENAEILAW